MARHLGLIPGLTLLAAAASALAAEPPAPSPSAELLLYLAEFHDAAGREIDPIEVAAVSDDTEPAPPAAASNKRESNHSSPKANQDESKSPPHR